MMAEKASWKGTALSARGGAPQLNILGTLSQPRLRKSRPGRNQDETPNAAAEEAQTEGRNKSPAVVGKTQRGWTELKFNLNRIQTPQQPGGDIVNNSGSRGKQTQDYSRQGFLDELFHPTQPPPEESALAGVRPLSERSLLPVPDTKAQPEQKQASLNEENPIAMEPPRHRGGFQFQPGLGVFRVNTDVKSAGDGVNDNVEAVEWAAGPFGAGQGSSAAGWESGWRSSGVYRLDERVRDRQGLQIQDLQERNASLKAELAARRYKPPDGSTPWEPVAAVQRRAIASLDRENATLQAALSEPPSDATRDLNGAGASAKSPGTNPPRYAGIIKKRIQKPPKDDGKAATHPHNGIESFTKKQLATASDDAFEIGLEVFLKEARHSFNKIGNKKRHDGMRWQPKPALPAGAGSRPGSPLFEPPPKSHLADHLSAKELEHVSREMSALHHDLRQSLPSTLEPPKELPPDCVVRTTHEREQSQLYGCNFIYDAHGQKIFKDVPHGTYQEVVAKIRDRVWGDFGPPILNPPTKTP